MHLKCIAPNLFKIALVNELVDRSLLLRYRRTYFPQKTNAPLRPEKSELQETEGGHNFAPRFRHRQTFAS